MPGISNIFQKQKNPPPSQTPNENRKKILIIEDEVDISEIYQQILKDGGYDVYAAANGQEGLNKIIEVFPNLILLDLRMPVMDGKTMLAHLKSDPEYANYKNIPVVVLTNSGRSDNIRDTITLGEASDFIIKASITPDQVLEIAKRYLH